MNSYRLVTIAVLASLLLTPRAPGSSVQAAGMIAAGGGETCPVPGRLRLRQHQGAAASRRRSMPLPASAAALTDPLAVKYLFSIGAQSPVGQFDYPRGVAVGLHGTYVADPNNHRIQHFSATGDFLGVWGRLAAMTGGPADPRAQRSGRTAQSM